MNERLMKIKENWSIEVLSNTKQRHGQFTQQTNVRLCVIGQLDYSSRQTLPQLFRRSISAYDGAFGCFSKGCNLEELLKDREIAI